MAYQLPHAPWVLEPQTVDLKYTLAPKWPLYPSLDAYHHWAGGVSRASTYQPPQSDTHGYRLGKYYGRSGFNNLYFRLLPSRQNLYLGIITGDRGESFTVWNGYFHSLSVDRITLDNLNGVSVEPLGGGGLPITMPPLESAWMQIHVSAQGSTSLNGSFTLHLSNGETLTIGVQGQRLVMCDVPPNWNDNYSETYSYKTDIITSWNNREQRRSLVPQPRRRIEYHANPVRQQAGGFRNLVRRWQGRGYMLPLWNQKTRLLSPTRMSGTEIVVDMSNNLDLVQGGSVCLWKNPYVYEIAEIIRVSGNRLSLGNPLGRAWQIEECTVMPAVTAYLSSDTGFAWKTHTVGDGNLNWTIDVGSLKIKMPNLPPDITYNGYEVLDKRPTWSETISDNWAAHVEVVDFGWGLQKYFDRGVASQPLRQQTYYANGYAECRWWKGFIQRCRGSYKAFLVPSGLEDGFIVAPYASGSNQIDVRDDRMSLLDSGQYIRLQNHEGIYFRKITKVEFFNGVARFTLDNGIPDNTTADQFKPVQFLRLCRLASDEITINYVTQNVAKITLKMQQVIE